MGLYDVGSALVRGDMDPSDSFAWNEYLEKTGGSPAAWECFKQVRISVIEFVYLYFHIFRVYFSIFVYLLLIYVTNIN
ncbi:unnamed protein product [Rodentolepis nana]|uniref:Uncharacterized protein n=1 Tax=Rodentolepis nana TaxID=102285 RepID=A0A0R3T609_RODNA|nr:unnamed protein product [Rodentolepis nana]